MPTRRDCLRGLSPDDHPADNRADRRTFTPIEQYPLAVGEFSKFAGTWVVTSAKYDGEDLPNQVGLEYIFAAGKLTLRQGDRVLDTAEVVLDTSAKPKAVDFISDHPKEGEPPPRYIYEFDGDVLRLCTRDKERPTSFAGKEQIVFTLKRKKG